MAALTQTLLNRAQIGVLLEDLLWASAAWENLRRDVPVAPVPPVHDADFAEQQRYEQARIEAEIARALWTAELRIHQHETERLTDLLGALLPDTARAFGEAFGGSYLVQVVRRHARTDGTTAYLLMIRLRYSEREG